MRRASAGRPGVSRRWSEVVSATFRSLLVNSGVVETHQAKRDCFLLHFHCLPVTPTMPYLLFFSTEASLPIAHSQMQCKHCKVGLHVMVKRQIHKFHRRFFATCFLGARSDPAMGHWQMARTKCKREHCKLLCGASKCGPVQHTLLTGGSLLPSAHRKCYQAYELDSRGKKSESAAPVTVFFTSWPPGATKDHLDQRSHGPQSARQRHYNCRCTRQG